MQTTNNPGSGTGVLNTDTAADKIASMLTDDLLIGNNQPEAKQDKRAVSQSAGQAETHPESHDVENEHPDESDTEMDDGQGDGPTEENEGDDESNTPESENHDSVSDDTTFSIRDGDKEVNVTLAELKNGYQRQSDYTRKSQALAEERKAFQTEAQQAQAEREQYRNGLAQAMQIMQATQPQEPTADQWAELQATDPMQFLQLREQWREHKERMSAVANEYQALSQRQQAEMNKALQARMAEESEKLNAAFPEWTDKAKAQAGKAAIRDYAKDLGYSDDEINTTTDHRIFVLAHKAMMYDRMIAKGKPRPDAQPNQTNKTKVVRPGTAATAPNSKRSAVQDARKQLQRSGKVEDAARLLEKLL
ncbi:hypothetical protein [Burkholderia vietnamiensis]|uniref:hypothetical protein n=1 Tax=Burkholderia vietnamiensis TaxID=60552 RepID=UPI0018DDA5CE|nr:hypothetical protein [Burkholderia vietnamiensis]MBH9642352.1 hypothetical protein [Burkholderia vietnamiensis]HDR9253547.1 hypothetical protein [Burkholderia vietnamiensis]